VAEVLGDRAAERFLLSDAQFVLVQEHGFRTWAEFRAHIQSQSTTDDRPVSRLAGTSPGHYASMADGLLTDLHRNARHAATVAGLCAPARGHYRPLHRRAWRRAADHRTGAAGCTCSSPLPGTIP